MRSNLIKVLAAAMLAMGLPALAFAASSVTQSVYSASGAPSLSPTNTGDLLLLVTVTSGGAGNPYVTAISDTQGNTWNQSVLGTFGASSSYWIGNSAYFVSAFYTYAKATTADTVTITYNGGTPGANNAWLIDCAGVASSSVLLATIHNDQTSPGTGTDAVTTSGGTGSGTVTLGSAPGALLVGAFWSVNGSTFTAGTGYTQSIGGFNAGYLVEYQRVASSGTYNATATVAANEESLSWMIALSEPVGGGGSCTDAGYEPNPGAIAVPNGTSGSFLLCNGHTGTPDCSSIIYYQPAGGKCGVD